MKIYLIRHGMTAGNLEKRYIGCRTDEPLCPAGIEQLQKNTYPQADKIFVSPMKRCIETARLIYPKQPIQTEPLLKEMDFGDFEGHNYQELNGSAAYQAWIDSNGTLPFPNGESREDFSRRCVAGFQSCLAACGESATAAFIVHGGTIMSIMEQYGTPRGEYYKWQIKNGEYLTLNITLPY